MRSIRLSNVGVTRGHTRIVEDIGLNVPAGQFVCLVGPSGSGKSTLLRAIGGLLPCSGSVLVGNVAPEDAWRHMSYVFQHPLLVQWRSAVKNVELGLELRNGRRDMTKSQRRDKAVDLLRLVGLEESNWKHVSMLSGGERQRVAIARALAVDPDILLMDEPFSALDIHTRSRLRCQVLDLWERKQLTVIFVTHDVSEAVSLADRIVVLGGNPVSSVLADLIVDIPRPRDEKSAGFTKVSEWVLDQIERGS